MRVVFWYQCGEIDEIGTGHRFRSRFIGEQLTQRGHEVTYIEDNDVVADNYDVMIIDHINPPKDISKRAKSMGMKVVVIDGKDPVADISISAFLNDDADYKGIMYATFPVSPYSMKYDSDNGSDIAFVGMGGFDKNNYAKVVLEILMEMKINAIVTHSINHPDFKKEFPGVEVFCGNNYCDAMNKCLFAITNGGLTFFQALHFGIPTIAIPQYEHQVTNISAVNCCCISCCPDKNDISASVHIMANSKCRRRDLSVLSQHYIDGRGVERICNIIEEIE